MRAISLALGLVLGAGLLAGCHDDPAPSPDAGSTADGGTVACVDRPTDLDRPPAGALPCSLVPPGMAR